MIVNSIPEFGIPIAGEISQCDYDNPKQLSNCTCWTPFPYPIRKLWWSSHIQFYPNYVWLSAYYQEQSMKWCPLESEDVPTWFLNAKDKPSSQVSCCLIRITGIENTNPQQIPGINSKNVGDTLPVLLLQHSKLPTASWNLNGEAESITNTSKIWSVKNLNERQSMLVLLQDIETYAAKLRISHDILWHVDAYCNYIAILILRTKNSNIPW